MGATAPRTALRFPEDASIRVSGPELAERLWLHAGTQRPPSAVDGGEPYTAHASTPLIDRRRLSDAELERITSPWHWPAPNCVASFAVDAPFLADVRRPELAGLDPMTPDYENIGDLLWERLCASSQVTSLGPVQWLGVSQRPSGLHTSTLDVTIGRRIGLHVDSWDHMPLGIRHLARTRLCLNLGERMRSLLFLPFDVRAIAGAMVADSQAHSGNLGERFCAAFRNAPVLRLDIPPGWAYLAPTENLIHDGCSEPSEKPDLTAAWLGRISYSGVA
jgi:hypothetical protein